MAETIIKHVSAENLKQYDGLIKQYLETKDAAVKAALEEQIGIVAEALDKEIADARAAEQANATAASNAKTAADNAQADVNALAGKVGEVPSGKTVVGMIEQVIADAYDDTEVRGLITNLDTNKADKTQVATDISNAVKAEEDARKEAVAGVQGSVDTLAQTVANNKTAIEGTVATLEQKVDDNEADIEGKMTALTNRVAANETAVGTTLPNAINAEKTRAEEAEAGLQTQINTIMNNPDTEGVINSINEFTQYIEDHGEIADGFRTDIDKNKADIASNQKSIADHIATDHDFAAADTALKNELNAEIAKKANSTTVEAMDEAYKAADTAIKGRLDVLEAINHDAYIAADTALKNELNGEIAKKADSTTVDQLAETVATKASQADLNAATSRVGTLESDMTQAKADIDALEAASATHALASDLTAANGKITTAEGKISTLESEMDEVQAELAAIEFMSTTDVANLFA